MIKINPVVIILMIIIISFPAELLSSEEEGLRITKINIEGNKRTRNDYILRIINVSPGDKWTPQTDENIRQRLIARKIFVADTLRVSSEPSDDGYIINIFIEDKWTLIPLPMAMISNDNWMAGVMILEMNFLGRGIMINGGLFVSENSISGMTGIGFKNIFFSGGYIEQNRNDKTIENKEEKTVRSFKVDRPFAEISPNIKINNWKLSVSVGYQHAEISEADYNITDYAPETEDYITGGFSVSFNNLEYKSGYNCGTDAQLSINCMNPDYYSLKLKGSYSLTAADLLLSAAADSGFGDLPATNQFQIGNGKSGSMTLPDSIYATRYFSTNVSITKKIINTKKLDLNLLALYESGVCRDLFEKNIYYYGPGSGFTITFDRIAVPALGIYCTWNIPLAQPYTIVTFGMRF
ncbi:MAG: hypothetical protein JW982_13015 [Spirochaetes bacterium]|nr:hypothetical protein [Spirochaetota bacterium]